MSGCIFSFQDLQWIYENDIPKQITLVERRWNSRGRGRKMGSGKGKVTIKDISLKCGVSVATVSKALNHYGDIAPKPVELIRKTAREMHYIP